MTQAISANKNLQKLTDLAEQLGRMWGLSGSPYFITQSENVVYEMNGQILRLTENGHRTASQLNAELDFISELWAGGVSVAKPQIAINGAKVVTVGKHHCSVFGKAEGVIGSAENTFSSLKTAHSLGCELGKIHALTVDFLPKASKRYHFIDIIHLKDGLKSLPAEDELATTEFQKGMNWIKALPSDKNVYGLVHMDVHNRNFSVDNDNITLFDFDDCAYNFFAYDLATPLYSIQRSRLSDVQKQDARSALLEGYSEAYNLPDNWLGLIDGFIRFRDIEMFAWCCYTFGIPQNKKTGGNISFEDFNPPFKRIADDFNAPYPIL